MTRRISEGVISRWLCARGRKLLVLRSQWKSSSCSCSQEQRSNSNSQRSPEIPGKCFPIYGRQKEEISWLQGMQPQITVVLPYHIMFRTLQYHPDSNIQIECFNLLHTAVSMDCVSLFLHKSSPQSQNQWEKVLALHIFFLQTPIWSM